LLLLAVHTDAEIATLIAALEELWAATRSAKANM
jgi:hypothetical protein